MLLSNINDVVDVEPVVAKVALLNLKGSLSNLMQLNFSQDVKISH